VTGGEILFAVVFSVAFAIGYPLMDKLFFRNKENVDQEWRELERSFHQGSFDRFHEEALMRLEARNEIRRRRGEI